jgi:hypothetical protein
MYKVIIAGTRDFNDYELLKQKCDFYLSQKQGITIISGLCTGADTLGIRYAREHEYPYIGFPADWNKYGKSAGPKRNEQMANIADACIVFWNGTSKGTLDMINRAKAHNIQLRIVKYK